MNVHPLPALRLLVDPAPHLAAWNMALDEALLESAPTHPTLRFYRWERLAVSFGCFQPWAEVGRRFPARELVRRPTGGGAVEHGDAGETATYALVVPRADGALAGLGERPAAAFRRVHAALAEALAAQGVAVESHDDDDGGAAGRLGGACFHDRPVPGDLVLAGGGQKVAGAAQRRTRAGLLHQGSIRVPGGVNISRLAEAFAGALTGGPTRWLDAAPGAGVRGWAEELARTQYGQAAWTERR